MEEQLLKLVTETCRHKPGTLKRQLGLTQIVRLIIKSGKLWKDNTPNYEDALQQTWIYFCRNLCEATTADKYDPRRSSVITWLNAYLKRRLQDGRIQDHNKQVQFATEKMWETDEPFDLIETLEAPADIPPILETTTEWAMTDPDGELRCIYIQGHPEVSCQFLILQRLPPETSWEKLAAKCSISVSTLSSFYRRHCIPRLRQFGNSQGYL